MTIEASATRLNEDSSSGVLNDQGVKDLARDLKAVFDSTAEDSVISAVRTELNSTYGASNVTEAAAPNSYRYAWISAAFDEDLISQSTFTIDDGETNMLRAVVRVLKTV
jgi:hypothetical protein